MTDKKTVDELRSENERLRAVISNPPKHQWWGASEPGCPPYLKAGNGEIHTLRCKICGETSPRNKICLGRTPTPPTNDLRAAMEALRPYTSGPWHLKVVGDVLAAWDRQQGKRS